MGTKTNVGMALLQIKNAKELRLVARMAVIYVNLVLQGACKWPKLYYALNLCFLALKGMVSATVTKETWAKPRIVGIILLQRLKPNLAGLWQKNGSRGDFLLMLAMFGIHGLKMQQALMLKKKSKTKKKQLTKS